MSTLTFDRIPASVRRPAPRAARRAPAAPVILAAPAPAAPPRPWGQLALVGAIAALHGVAVLALAHGPRAVPAAPAAVPIAIALAAPPQVLPPPPPPPPRLRATPAPRLKPSAPLPVAAPAPAPRSAPPSVPVVASATPLVAASSDTVQVARAPVAAAEAPPAAPDDAVTEPRGYAGYLRNPAPDYPPAAQKRGLEGKVVLKVHVLASGQPDSVAVASSSGHPILDDAALKAVTRWAFAPARRGATAIDGWVQVPLQFKI
jgi:protein TonB